MTDDNATPEPGMYPVPGQPGMQDWWDGTAWRGSPEPIPPPTAPPPAAPTPVAPAPPVAAPPPAAPPSLGAPPPMGAPPAYAGPAVTPAPPKKNRTAMYVILGILAFLIVGVVGCTAAIILVSGDVIDELEEQIDERQADEIIVEENTEILRCERNDAGQAVVELEFVSTLNEERGFVSVEVNFLDGDDVVIGNATVIFNNLSPGQTARGEATDFSMSDTAEIDRCEVTDGIVL